MKFTYPKKELQKSILKMTIGFILTSLVTYLSVDIQAVWESVLSDLFIFAGIACTIWGLWGFVIAHKQIENHA